MPIFVASSLAPKNGGTFFLLDDRSLRGGFQIRNTFIDRDDISSINKKEGMLVLVLEDHKIYQLGSDLSTWAELQATPSSHTHDFNTVTTDSTHRFVTDSEKAVWDGKQAALGYTPVDSSEKGSANGFASLNSLGKVPNAQMPDISITDTYVVLTEAEMLGITCQTGDVAVRVDLNKCFILKGTNPTQLGDWQELLSPVSQLLSVSVSAPLVNAGTAGAPIITLPEATTTTAGYISSTYLSKLDALPADANNYVHPTGDGALHVPATGTTSNNKVLTAGATEGSLSWQTPATGVASVSANTPLLSSGGTAPVISMPAAANGVSGYLTSTDWSTFNSKGYGTVTNVSGNGPISVTNGNLSPSISIADATTSASGTMSAADKIKLDGVEANATAYTHPTSDGSLHVPATGTTSDGKVLTAGATAGSLSWTTPAATGVTDVSGTAPISSSGGATPSISISAATATDAGSMSAADKTKLDGIASGATANLGTVTAVSGTSPIVSSGGTTPDISMAAATASVNGYMSSAYASKLDGIAENATAYTHPTSDGSLHVPATSTTNSGKVLTAGASAGSLSWTTPTTGTVTSVAALTLGTSGTDVSSSVATDTTTPVITLNIPTASATNRGALSAADWSTFNGKGSGTVTNVTGSGAISVATGTSTPEISIVAATTAVPGTMSAADKTKLDGIASGATSVTNTNQLTNGAGFITSAGAPVQSVSGTAPVVSSGGATPAISMAAASSGVNGYMTGAYATKLDGIAAGATAYVHPTADGSLHVPATSTTNNGKVLTAGATAGSLSWTTPAAAGVTSVAGAGAVNGLTLTGTVTATGSLTLGGSITSVATTGNFQMNSLGVGTAAAATAGDIRATGDITAFYSDVRLKAVEGTIDRALDKVMSLSGVYYRGNDVAESFGYTSNVLQVGVLAQEVQAVMPELVVPAPFDIAQNEDGSEYSKSGQDYLTVKYDRLVPLLIEAIKEQQAQIDSLRVMLAVQQTQ